MSSPSGVQVTCGAIIVDGDLMVPPAASGVVVFAHGSGSSRHSPRNRQVAAGLQQAGMATLLLDLLTEPEGRLDALTGRLRFDIGLLSERLVGAVDWLEGRMALPVALFGASTGAAAALVAAADRPGVRAVVCRGGRPDLAGPQLSRVRSPVLLIVGGNDSQVLRLNEAAAQDLPGHVELEVVTGASHLFPEPGALERVTDLATRWLPQWLAHSGEITQDVRP